MTENPRVGPEAFFSRQGGDNARRAPVATRSPQPPAGGTRHVPASPGQRAAAHIVRTDETRIVIALDYGTTNSGIAWTTVAANKTPLMDDIQTFDAWPRRSEDKVPSMISFSTAPNGEAQYGYDIAPGSTTLQWNKLELKDPVKRDQELKLFQRALQDLVYLDKVRDSTLTEERENELDIPRHVGKSPEEIVSEYMYRIATRFRDVIEGYDESEALLRETPIDFVVTHPATSVWSYSALNKTVKAIRAAFDAEAFTNIRNFSLCSEPEATAIYNICRDDLGKKPDVGRTFIVADAGGGTVDLASFKVTSLKPSIGIQRVGRLTGQLCGAVFINQAFFRWLQSEVTDGLGVNVDEIGSGGQNCFPPVALTIHDNFEGIKKFFGGDESREFIPLALPTGVRIKEPRPTVTVGNSTRELVVGSELNVPREQMVRSFASSVNGLISLLRSQYQLLESNWKDNGRVTHVYLAGGLCNNKYVQRRVTEWARTQTSNLKVVVATGEDQKEHHPWNAVAIGAVIREAGIAGMRSPALEFFPRSYGFKLVSGNERFPLRRNIWMIRKDDIIIPGESRSVKHPFEYFAPARSIVTLKLDILVTNESIPPVSGNLDRKKPEEAVLSFKPKLQNGFSVLVDRQQHQYRAVIEFLYEKGDNITVSITSGKKVEWKETFSMTPRA